MALPRPACAGIRAIWLAVAASSLLPACIALGPQPALPRVEMPPRWAGADAVEQAPAGADGRTLVGWWRRFDDPQLDSLVERALLHGTRVASAQATLQQALALRDAAAAGLAPTLGGSASVQHGTAAGRSTGTRFALGLQAQWQPDLSGAAHRALDARVEAAAGSAATLGDVQVQLAGEVALEYLLLRSAQARLVIANDNLASQQHTLQITDWRLQAGLVSALDREQAHAATEQTRSLVPARQTAIEQAAHALAVLTGQPPAALATELGTFVPLPQTRDDAVLGLPAELLLQRADLRAAEHEVGAAWARVGQARAQRWPGLSLGADLGLNALTVGALTNGASVVGTLLASLAGPILDGGANAALVRAQRAELVLAQQAWRATLLGALKDVEDALAALRGDRARRFSLAAAADAATRAATLARQRYASGLVDFQTVLETQRNQLAAQDSVAAVHADIGADQVRLFLALGGGWRPLDDPATAWRTP